MRCRTVDADGNCLFRAASVALSGDYNLSAGEEYDMATELRSAVVAFMRKNRASFEHFVMDDVLDFEQYMQKMETPREWGGELEVSAIARLKRRPVHVYQLEGGRYELLSQYPAGSDACADKISLLFSVRHYDALFEE